MRKDLPAYPAYKDSGIEWIGEVPEEWEFLHYKRVCTRVDVGIAEAATHAYTDVGVPIIRSTNVRPNLLNTSDILKIQEWFAEKNKSKYLRAGDLVTVRTGYPGVTAVVPPELDMSQCFTLVMSSLRKGHLPSFFSYFMNSIHGMTHFNVTGWGSAQINISVPIVQHCPIVLPSIPEQEAIVAFLDRETAKIDRLKDVRRRQIEVLREQRAAVIHHAVTQGLDPDAPKKDSEHPWLEPIPASWSVVRLKFTATINPSKGASGYYSEAEDQVVFLPMEAVTAMGQVDQSNRGQVKVLWKGFTYFERGDVVVAKITPCFENGKGAHLADLETELGFGTTEFHVLRPGKAINGRFLYLLTVTTRFRGLGARFMTGAAGQQRVPPSFISNFPVALPPLAEQEAIVARIDAETATIDALIGKYERELELLDEYRASLISHAVTGKIDVRGQVELSPSGDL